MTGYKGSGKDTAAKIIAEHAAIDNTYTVKTFAFATLLKEICELILVRCGFNFKPEHFTDPILKETLITHKTSKNPFQFFAETSRSFITLTYRRLLQLVGTELFRNLIHSDIWIMPAYKEINDMPDNSILVITDTRFPNEYFRIHNYLFNKHLANRNEYSLHLIGINRNTQRNSEHSSETSIADLLNLSDCIIIGNNSSLELFKHNVVAIYQSEIQKSLTKPGGRDGRKKKNT